MTLEQLEVILGNMELRTHGEFLICKNLAKGGNQSVGPDGNGRLGRSNSTNPSSALAARVVIGEPRPNPRRKDSMVRFPSRLPATGFSDGSNRKEPVKTPL